MAIELNHFLAIVVLLCCVAAATGVAWSVLSKSGSTPEVVLEKAEIGSSSRTSSISRESKAQAKQKDAVTVNPDFSAARQLSLSDSGSNDSGPAAVSPLRRAAGIAAVGSWPEARWSKVFDASLPKKAIAVILEVISASRRQKQRE